MTASHLEWVQNRTGYQNRKLNYVLHAGFASLFVATFLLARTQMPVGNEQFLRS